MRSEATAVGRRPLLLVILAATAVLTAVVATRLGGSAGSSGADVVAVSGSATGFFSSVSLFGGPASQRGPVGTPGCDPNQPAPGPNATRTEGCSPSVALPSNGSNEPVTMTAKEGVRAVYGPAVVFGGDWPAQNTIGPPTGPIAVRTQRTPGHDASVTSSVSIDRAPPASTWTPPGHPGTQRWPGGIGPGPLIAERVTSTCTAQVDPAGGLRVAGSTTITNGVLSLTTDPSGSPASFEPMPTTPRPNDGPHGGVLTNIGDSYEVIYNEQDVSVPGAITVTAIHMRLIGPTAVGDLYIGRVHCAVPPGS
jgi:hypothetical protein